MWTILYGVYAIRFNADGLLSTVIRGVQPNVLGIAVWETGSSAWLWCLGQQSVCVLSVGMYVGMLVSIVASRYYVRYSVAKLS